MLCFMISRTVTLFVSRCFATDAMGIAPIETLSIRNIRTMVQKVCYDLFEVLVHPKRCHSATGDLQRSLSESRPGFEFPWFLLLEFAWTPKEGWNALMWHLREERKLETFYEEREVNMIPFIATERADENPKVMTFKDEIMTICGSEERMKIQEEVGAIIKRTMQEVLPPFKRVSTASEG